MLRDILTTLVLVIEVRDAVGRVDRCDVKILKLRRLEIDLVLAPSVAFGTTVLL